MSTVGKILNGIWYLLIILIVISISIGAITEKPTLISYATSDSMEPTIGVHDYFLIIPKNLTQFAVNDIVVFQSTEKGYLVHRIVGENDHGFITQGDNSPFSDQQTGEPFVRKSQIIGRVLTYKGNPIIIPGLWKYIKHFEVLSRFINRNALIMAGFIIGLGIATLVIEGKSPKKQFHRYKKPLRVKHIMIPALLLMAIISIIFMMMAQEKVSYDYHVTYTSYEGIPTAIPGTNFEVIVELDNFSPIPHYAFISAPSSITDSAHLSTLVNANTKKKLSLWFTADSYQGPSTETIFIHRYLPLLPRKYLFAFFQMHPYLPILVIDSEILVMVLLLTWFSNPNQIIIRKEKRIGGIP
jgi:signal peptidase